MSAKWKAVYSRTQDFDLHFRSVLTEDLNKKHEKWKAKSNKTEV